MSVIIEPSAVAEEGRYDFGEGVEAMTVEWRVFKLNERTRYPVQIKTTLGELCASAEYEVDPVAMHRFTESDWRKRVMVLAAMTVRSAMQSRGTA